MVLRVEKYLIKSSIRHLKDYSMMFDNQIDAMEDSSSEMYQSVVNNIKSGNVEVSDEDVETQIKQMKINITTNGIEVKEIINDLEKSINDETDDVIITEEIDVEEVD
jgi:hypothetical protein